MKLYADSSVVVAYYAPEALSEQAEEILRAYAEPAVSDLIEVEMFSAVARKVRQGELEQEDADRFQAVFLSHLAAGFYRRLPLEPRCYRLARDWLATCPHVPLRSLDTLHLAAAALAERTLVTADVRQWEAGRALGVSAMLLKEEIEQGFTLHDAAAG